MAVFHVKIENPGIFLGYMIVDYGLVEEQMTGKCP